MLLKLLFVIFTNYIFPEVKTTLRLTTCSSNMGYQTIHMFWIEKRWGRRTLTAYYLLIPLTSSSTSEKWQSHWQPWTHPRKSSADHIHHDAFSFPASDGKWSDWIPFHIRWRAFCGLRDAAVMSLNNQPEEKRNRWRDDESSGPHWIWGWLIR